jgi:hypothetical protein
MFDFYGNLSLFCPSREWVTMLAVNDTERKLEEQLSLAKNSYQRGMVLIRLALHRDQHGQLQDAYESIQQAVEILSVAADWDPAPDVHLALIYAEFLEQDYKWRLTHPTPSRWRKTMHGLHNHFFKVAASMSLQDDSFAV